MPRKANAEKEKKRRVVAKGVVAGRPTAKIAAEAGCTVRNVQRIASEPATQFLITEALQPHREELEQLAGDVIKAIGGGLRALKDDPEDHVVRLRAIERYGDMLQLAQGKPKEESEQGPVQITWEEFVVLYRKQSEVRA